VPGPDADLRRTAPAANSFCLCSVLQSGAHALGVTERCAPASSSPTVGCHYRHPNLGRTASSICSDMIFGKDNRFFGAGLRSSRRFFACSSSTANFTHCLARFENICARSGLWVLSARSVHRNAFSRHSFGSPGIALSLRAVPSQEPPMLTNQLTLALKSESVISTFALNYS
jgi:hypothetical protein